MEPLKPFEASRLKLSRAERHIQELRDEMAKYLAAEPLSIVVEELDGPGLKDCCSFVARIHKPVPRDFSATIGDAIHNLRATLDVLACDLVRMNSESAKDVQFPFAMNADELDLQIKKKKMTRASPAALALLRSLKPYTGGNIALRAIHDLDIKDKHQALIPAASVAALPPFILRAGQQHNLIPPFSSGVVMDGQYIMMLPKANGLPIGLKMPAQTSLVWDADTPFVGEPILEVLERLVKLVHGVVEAAADLYPGNQDFPIPPTPKKHPLVKGLILAPPGSMNPNPVGR
jgi:hypothetical protein